MQKNRRQIVDKGMTIKQIAELCGVDERTVQRWVLQISDKMSSISDKMSVSSPMHPASLTLPEVLSIIRAGGKNTLADLLSENASQNAITQHLDANKYPQSEREMDMFLLGYFYRQEQPERKPPSVYRRPPESHYNNPRLPATCPIPAHIQEFPMTMRGLASIFGVAHETIRRIAGKIGLDPAHGQLRPYSDIEAFSIWEALEKGPPYLLQHERLRLEAPLE